MRIMQMTAQELTLLDDFTKLAKEALEAAELINKHFNSAFGISKREIEVYRTESFGEYYGYGYLSIDGIFRYHDNWWGGREYAFSCDSDGIFKMLRSCYLREHDLESLDNEPFECNIDQLDSYFRDFIKSLKD